MFYKSKYVVVRGCQCVPVDRCRFYDRDDNGEYTGDFILTKFYV